MCFFLFLHTGDLGGYYGLFLGGSAISLFEILDLIIYNALVKLTTRRSLIRRSRIDPTYHSHVIDVKSLELQLTESANVNELEGGVNNKGFKRSMSSEKSSVDNVVVSSIP
jgi:hypothetical protein